jgi:hypothetical protein
MVEPGRQKPRPAEIAPVLVRHDVVRIVLSRALVPKRAEKVTRDPGRGVHSQESISRGTACEDTIERAPIEVLEIFELAVPKVQAGRQP